MSFSSWWRTARAAGGVLEQVPVGVFEEGVSDLLAGGAGSVAAVLHEVIAVLDGVQPEEIAREMVEGLGGLLFGDVFAEGLHHRDEARRDPIEGDAVGGQLALVDSVEDAEEHGWLVEAVLPVHGSKNLPEILQTSRLVREVGDSRLVGCKGEWFGLQDRVTDGSGVIQSHEFHAAGGLHRLDKPLRPGKGYALRLLAIESCHEHTIIIDGIHHIAALVLRTGEQDLLVVVVAENGRKRMRFGNRMVGGISIHGPQNGPKCIKRFFKKTTNSWAERFKLAGFEV